MTRVREEPAPPVGVPQIDQAEARSAAAEPWVVYRERAERFGALRDALTARWERIAHARLAVFLVATALAAWGALDGRPWLVGAGSAFLVGFVALVVYHGHLDRQRRRFADLHTVNAEGLSRLARDWDALPPQPPAAVAVDTRHPYAADLDLFGRASLYHLLDTVSTRLGERTLRAWLLAPANPATVGERQAAARELAPRVDWRDELRVRGGLDRSRRPDPEPFLVWAEDEPWLTVRPALLLAARLSTVLLWLLLGADVAGLLEQPLWLAPLAINLGLALWLVNGARRRLAQAASQEGAFRHYAALLELLAGGRFAAPLLSALRARIEAAGVPAPEYARRLHTLTRFIMPPSSMLYLPIQVLTLWDVHLLTAFERWQRVAGRHVRVWLDALGETEALAGLATLSHDNPGWAWPALDPAAARLEAAALGHPLLPDTTRVDNDVTVGPPGSFLLVTGSNMSGKSTLLRSIGVNLVLAGAGAPVCAAAFRAPPVRLWTSMRISDSLAQGVSYFMAELQRLKAVVDAAATADPEGRRLLYLLDEILQGTNTAERQIAARRIVGHLVRLGALGAVSTHDLTLADTPELAAVAVPVHFTESFVAGPDGPAMTFDYRLRTGLARSTNALRLMEIVGLTLDGAAHDDRCSRGEAREGA